jgi:hypothetical protein
MIATRIALVVAVFTLSSRGALADAAAAGSVRGTVT